jgi:nucleoside-diphosphate-sugar epimerase
MNVCVTGSEGYIGSALVETLLKAKHHCVLRADIVNGIDITSDEGRRDIADWGPDVIVNLAGLSGELACDADTLRAIRLNAEAPMKLWEECGTGPVFIQASTASILGKKTVYGMTKEKAELDFLMKSACRESSGYRYRLFRFSTVWGIGREDRTRWDLPIHRMVQSRVRDGVVKANEDDQLYRPFIRLKTLVNLLCREIDAVEQYGDNYLPYAYPIPLCESNWVIKQVAKTVAGDDTPVEEFSDPEAVGYTMPRLGEIAWGTAMLKRELPELLDAAEGSWEKKWK